MSRRHTNLEPLPPVEMAPLRRMVTLVHHLELAEAGELVPAQTSPTSPLIVPQWSGLQMSGAVIKLVNLSNAIKRIADYPLRDWDDDPLVIRRWSELYDSN
jgi:hypothetical protein